MTRLLPLGIAVLALAASGCADEEEPEQEPFNICDNFDTEYEDIVAGMTKTGDAGVVQVKYVSSTPSPPAEGDNSWTVQLLDASGAPLGSGSVTEVTPWMPDHGHGTTVVPEMTDMDADGMVDVTAIDFRMPGVWTLTFTVETGTEVDTATFSVCIN